MYEGGTLKRWETPFSHASSLVMVSLFDDGKLTITLEDAKHIDRLRYKVIFDSAPMYRNILEEYRINESAVNAEQIENSNSRAWTHILIDSGWLKAMKEREDLIELNKPNLVHYSIATEDDVVDVLSDTVPIIIELGPASKNDAAAGKSKVLYHPEDLSKINKALKEAGNNE